MFPTRLRCPLRPALILKPRGLLQPFAQLSAAFVGRSGEKQGQKLSPRHHAPVGRRFSGLGDDRSQGLAFGERGAERVDVLAAETAEAASNRITRIPAMNRPKLCSNWSRKPGPFSMAVNAPRNARLP